MEGGTTTKTQRTRRAGGRRKRPRPSGNRFGLATDAKRAREGHGGKILSRFGVARFIGDERERRESSFARVEISADDGDCWFAAEREEWVLGK